MNRASLTTGEQEQSELLAEWHTGVEEWELTERNCDDDGGRNVKFLVVLVSSSQFLNRECNENNRYCSHNSRVSDISNRFEFTSS